MQCHIAKQFFTILSIGWGGAFATSYWVDPQKKMVMLFYRQLRNTTHGDVVEKFRSLVYQAIND